MPALRNPCTDDLSQNAASLRQGGGRQPKNAMRLPGTLLKAFGDIALIGSRTVPSWPHGARVDGAVNPASRTVVGAVRRRRAPARVSPSTEPTRGRWLDSQIDAVSPRTPFEGRGGLGK